MGKFQRFVVHFGEGRMCAKPCIYLKIWVNKMSIFEKCVCTLPSVGKIVQNGLLFGNCEEINKNGTLNPGIDLILLY